MKQIVIFTVVCGIAVCQQLAAQQTDQTSSLDESAIQRTVRTYVDAFNRGDAAAVAMHWSEDGVWVSPAGERIQGRAAIQQSLEEFFAETNGQQRIEVFQPSIRQLAPTVAVEEGRARVTGRGTAPSETTYIAIHVKKNDEWKIESVRETNIPLTPSNYQQLQGLEWMIGEWVDQDDSGTIQTTCEWIANKNFISRSFTVRIKDRINATGTQIIGWDSLAEQIRSWVFDSDGGFGEGIWSRSGVERWMVKAKHIFQDGARASAIRIITPVDADSFRLEVIGREIDGEIQPNIDPVTVRRK